MHVAIKTLVFDNMEFVALFVRLAQNKCVKERHSAAVNSANVTKYYAVSAKRILQRRMAHSNNCTSSRLLVCLGYKW